MRKDRWEWLAVTWFLLASQSAGVASPVKEREQTLQQQASLWQEAVRLRQEGKLPACREAAGRAAALEKDLFGDASHTLLYLTEYQANVAEAAKDRPAAGRLRSDAVAIQFRFLGDHPGGETGATAARRQEQLEQVLAVRRRVLGAGHRWVGLTLVDLALAQEAGGHPDAAEASLRQASALFDAIRYEPGFLPPGHLPDARYHLDRLRLATGGPEASAALRQLVPEGLARRLEEARQRAAEAEAREAKGDLEGARSLWQGVFGGYQGFGGEALFCSEQAQMELARGYHDILDRLLSFAARHGLPEKDAAGIYFGVSGLKGSIFTRARAIRLERRHPALKPFFDAYDDILRQLAGSTGLGTDNRPTGGPEPVQSLLVRRNALEAEMGRRRTRLPQFMAAPPATQLPRGAALVDYLVYQDVPLSGAAKGDTLQRHLVCFISRPPSRVVYLELGPLRPVEQVVAGWRLSIQGGATRHPPAQALRKRIWEPLRPYLDKADLVLISPDGILTLVPFAALPGAKPGTYLLEELSLTIAPTPRLVLPLQSQTDFLARRDGGFWTTEILPEAEATPLLVGAVDFEADPEPRADRVVAPRASPPGREGQGAGRFAPLPQTAREVKRIDDLFRRLFPGKEPVVLTGPAATKAAVRREAPRHRWLHLATHGVFVPRSATAPLDLPETRSALALAGASLPRHGETGLLTALEVASLDLDRVDLAVLSACETGLGEVEEGEGVLGLQRAFQGAGVKTTVTSLWRVDDEATQALMVEFYRNLWERKLGKVEALRQAQLAMLGGRLYRPGGGGDPAEGIGSDLRTDPFFWAAFALGGDWR